MLAKPQRLEKRQVEYILKKGQSSTSKLFILKFTENNEEKSKYATIISSKISKKAVERNKLRRQIYEIIRTALKESTPEKNLNLVLIPKKQILSSSFEEIQEDIKEIIIQNGKIN